MTTNTSPSDQSPTEADTVAQWQTLALELTNRLIKSVQFHGETALALNNIVSQVGHNLPVDELMKIQETANNLAAFMKDQEEFSSRLNPLLLSLQQQLNSSDS